MTGCVLFIVGLLLRLAAIRALRGNFSLLLGMPDAVVANGIYRYMRHPSYFGSILMILGAGLIHPVLGLALISIAFFMARIVNEEQVLLQSPAYREYWKKTGIICPRLRRK